MPVSLSDDKLAIVMDCAPPFAPKDRDAFLRDVATELAKHPDEFGPGTVHRLVRETQRRYCDPPNLVGGSGTPRWSR